MRLAPMFSYYGSKWRLAPKYPPPQQKLIIEPFAGSACYSLFWGAATSSNLFKQPWVRLYDLNERICMIWDYLIRATKEEILALPDLKADQPIPDNLPEEARYLIGFWTTKGSPTPALKQQRNYRPDLGYWSPGIRNRIAGQLDQIRHWTVDCMCYTEIEDEPATWFIDPPYTTGGDRYVHSDIDYQVLGEWCRSRTGQRIVCENGSADWLDFQAFEATKGTRKGSVELIWEQR